MDGTGPHAAGRAAIPMTSVTEHAAPRGTHRQEGFTDPFGHRWTISSHVEDVSPEDMERRMAEMGAGEILLTSMDMDGQLTGYDLELTSAVSNSVSVPVIASGGAGELEHLYQAVTAGGADAVLAASIFHYGTWRVRDTKDYLAGRGVPVRPVEEADG